MTSVLLYIPVDAGEDSTTVVLPKNRGVSELDMAYAMAEDMMGSDGCIVHEITTEIIAFTLVQDGMYQYNKSATYAIKETQGIMVAFEGPVCLYIKPPELLSR